MKKALTKTLFSSMTLLAFSCYAEDDAVQEETFSQLEENVIVDSRPLSQQKKQLMELNRQAELEEPEKKSEGEEIQLGVLIIPIKTHQFTTLAANHFNSTAANFSPLLYHWVDRFPQDNIIKTEDGSEWVFDKSDAYILRTWHPGDTIVITPKGRWIWGSNYAYVMTNKDIGSSINVNLFLGPVAFGPHSVWVVGIDYNMGQVYLLNGQGERTVWEVSQADLYLFKDWAVNDTLIIGENDSWVWWFSSHNHIILNVNMNHYVRARQISSTPNFRNGLRG